MTEKIAFISSADSNYYPLLREWIHSIRCFRESKDIDICIMDAGLTAEQIEKLTPYVAKIAKPDWPFPIPARKVKGKEYLKACIARPFIPDLFPGYDLYFWMDSDTWVQNWEAIDLFIQGGRRMKIALTGQVDRAYPRQLRVKWLGALPLKIRGFYANNIGKAFGKSLARRLMPYHVLLAGAFCLHREAPHWKRWQELVQQACRKGKVFTAEQTALGVMCYRDKYEFEMLPAWCHWLCEFPAVWNEENRVFVEPFLPHKPIGILHLSGVDEMREDRSAGMNFRTLNGEEIYMSYRYPRFDGALDEVVSNEPDMYDRTIKISINSQYYLDKERR
ncbi:MAG: hypothetical protein HYS17_07685 [Micavibrio aeruginosavorus]|uniref:Glycosyl transferase n=1 Tax=Micavibrio aeruginosavorus TaxID=349221 RepID=A0A7T5UGX9_9BACT|nr:MAG: hypothetical protein HYS17_07685 [Micavibrio aeruginosavorus]